MTGYHWLDSADRRAPPRSSFSATRGQARLFLLDAADMAAHTPADLRCLRDEDDNEG